MKRGESLCLTCPHTQPSPDLHGTQPPRQPQRSRGQQTHRACHGGYAHHTCLEDGTTCSAAAVCVYMYMYTCMCANFMVCNMQITCRLLIASSQDPTSTCALLLGVMIFEPPGNIYKRRYVNTAHVARGFKGHHSH